MATVTLEWQGNRSEDAQGVGAGFGRMVRVRCLAVRVNADELALGNKALADGRVDIAEHGERLPSRCRSRLGQKSLADRQVIKL